MALICDIHQKLVNIAFELVAERGKIGKEEKMNSVLHTTYPQKLPEQTSHRKKIERIKF